MKFVYKTRGKKGNNEEGQGVHVNSLGMLERKSDKGIEELVGT
jgi:hypothetical protein